MHVPEAKSAIVFSFSFHFLQTLLLPWLTWTSVPLCQRTLSHMFDFFPHPISLAGAQIGENDLEMEKGRKNIKTFLTSQVYIWIFHQWFIISAQVRNHGNWLVNISLNYCCWFFFYLNQIFPFWYHSFLCDDQNMTQTPEIMCLCVE